VTDSRTRPAIDSGAPSANPDGFGGEAKRQTLAPIDLLAAGLSDPACHGCLCLNAAATSRTPATPPTRFSAASTTGLASY
jgi:hypothetical protein